MEDKFQVLVAAVPAIKGNITKLPWARGGPTSSSDSASATSPIYPSRHSSGLAQVRPLTVRTFAVNVGSTAAYSSETNFP